MLVGGLPSSKTWRLQTLVVSRHMSHSNVFFRSVLYRILLALLYDTKFEDGRLAQLVRASC